MTKYIFHFIIAYTIVSCSHTSQNLDRALKIAGENRKELEKVLKHYGQNTDDRLKLKAAKFLIENMDEYFFYTSPELDLYYAALDSIFSLNERSDYITGEQEIMLSRLVKPDQDDFRIVWDLQYVSAGFLIDNIDRAFEDWKLPHAKELDFDDFCEFLLPYKSGQTEHPDFWRSIYRDTFSPYIKSGLDITCNPDSGLILNYPVIVMDGKNYISIPENFDTIPEFTISCWVIPAEYTSEARLFSFGRDSSWFVCFTPYNYGGVAQFLSVTMPYLWEDTSHISPLPLSKRSHIAVTYSKNMITFYIDGIPLKRMRTRMTSKDLIRNYIGKSQYVSESDIYFKGEITDFLIYNRELNYTEISKISGKTERPGWRQRIQLIIQGFSRLYIIRGIDEVLPGGYRSAQLINMKQGSCDDYVALGTSIFRSLGIPSSIDFIPHWASRSRGHSWNAIYMGNGRLEDYSFGDWADTIGHHIKVHEEKAAKIFRKTYAKQSDSPAMQNGKNEDLPPIFQSPCIKDITDSYLDCIDINVSLDRKPHEKLKYAYLSNFNNHDWVPVHWGEIKDGKAVFTKMGKDIAYLPVYYDRWDVTPAADPFILTKEGEMKKLIPDHSKTQTLILKRKYKPGNVPKKGELLVDGKFQVANKADFSDSLTIYVVNDVPEILYNTVDITLKKPYRYFRFISPTDSYGGEISEIEIYSNETGLKLTGKVIGNKNCQGGWEAENVFDGDPLTSYLCVWGETGWVGLDFGQPMNISYFRYLPRNDDNFIKEGEEYELFYWENDKWISLGKHIGTSKQYLEYTNAPLNALFWLRNLTKGREERIFTYEYGKQVWW